MPPERALDTGRQPCLSSVCLPLLHFKADVLASGHSQGDMPAPRPPLAESLAQVKMSDPGLLGGSGLHAPCAPRGPGPRGLLSY